MKLNRKIGSFFALSGKQRFFVCEAVILLAAARICVLIVPLRILSKWLACAPDAGAGDPKLVAEVRKAVVTAAHNVPWNAVCLPQAMAAKAMLARRGQGSAFHLGATLDESGRLSAHAWLECDGQIVTGAAGRRGISHLARFG